jgi:hypothetical protein
MTTNFSKKYTLSALRSIKASIVYPPDRARIAAQAIAADICDRRGLKSEWAQIDKDIQYEIVDTWTHIINIVFDSEFDIKEILANNEPPKE